MANLMQPRCEVDHLVVTAPDLAAGAELVRRALAVEAQVGGEHPRMGTHNLVLKLGDAVYLEIIAANPSAAKPERPRWFDLDEVRPDAPPRLATWVARTTDIHSTLAACSEPLGEIEPMSRGHLNWLITLPRDGSLAFHGVAPALIEWRSEAHPATRLQDAGCSLVRLEAFHPEAARISALLKSISLRGNVSVAASKHPYLAAHVRSPTGLKKLVGRAGRFTRSARRDPP